MSNRGFLQRFSRSGEPNLVAPQRFSDCDVAEMTEYPQLQLSPRIGLRASQRPGVEEEP
jgi:hypothetical protein